MITPAFYSGTGRRKTAIARVRIVPGEGRLFVNGKAADVMLDAVVFLAIGGDVQAFVGGGSGSGGRYASVPFE